MNKFQSYADGNLNSLYCYDIVANTVFELMVKSLVAHHQFSEEDAVALLRSKWLRHNVDSLEDFLFPAIDVWVKYGASQKVSDYLVSQGGINENS